MKKITVEDQSIGKIGSFLRSTDADEIIIRTSRVSGGWHDIEFDANRAGFNVYRFTNQEYADNHTFSQCYRFIRKGIK